MILILKVGRLENWLFRFSNERQNLIQWKIKDYLPPQRSETQPADSRKAAMIDFLELADKEISLVRRSARSNKNLNNRLPLKSNNGRFMYLMLLTAIWESRFATYQKLFKILTHRPG